MPTTIDGVSTARSLRELTAREASVSEQGRTLSQPLVDALWDSGLMTYLNAPEAGGCEPSFAEAIDTWIEMAWQDGSFGWIGIANLPSAAASSAYLPDAGFAEVFGDPERRVTVAGQFFPNGTGEATSDGYVLSGAWNFGSGTAHSEYIAAGFFPIVDGEAVFDLSQIQAALVHRDDVEFNDGWHVQGLKGTGSYDYAVDGVLVPEHRCFPLFEREPRRGTSPMFRMGMMPITAAGHAAWALGVSKSMLDDVAELAQTKARMSDMETLALRPTFQRNLAHHTGMWRAARAGVIEAFSRVPSRRSPRATSSHRRCVPTCAWPRPTPPRRRGRWRSGPTSPRARPPSVRAAAWSGRSGTSTPARSTRSSARRPTSTRRRSGWAWSTTSPGSDACRRRAPPPTDSTAIGSRWTTS